MTTDEQRHYAEAALNFCAAFNKRAEAEVECIRELRNALDDYRKSVCDELSKLSITLQDILEKLP